MCLLLFIEVEKRSYGVWDNTALNGIRLHCISLFNDSSLYEEDSSIQSNTARYSTQTQVS